MAVDLLVFGPHPDDLEIGAGGIIARHAALGFTVGLCDLTAGEMGSNGTVEERLKESKRLEGARAAWQENLRWPDRRIGRIRRISKRLSRSSAGIAPRVVVAP
jgi:LmbE family N-acetylglucosaminyl deacetylase